MDYQERIFRISTILEIYGAPNDKEFFQNLIKLNNIVANETTYFICPNCKKETSKSSIFCLEDLGIVACQLCKDQLE